MKAPNKIEHGHEQTDGVLHFFCHAPEARSVFVAGTFNEWQPDTTPMMRDDGCEWPVVLRARLRARISRLPEVPRQRVRRDKPRAGGAFKGYFDSCLNARCQPNE